MNSVAPGPAPGEDEDVPIGAHSVTDNLGFLPEADARHVDDDVAEIPLVEDDASGDGRDPDAIPVIADARDDAAEEVFRMLRPPRQFLRRNVEGPEVKRVREGDRLGAHRKDVPQDPADPRARPSVRLHRGRMTVALDPERVRVD